MEDTTTTTTTLPALKRVPPRQYRPRPVFWHQPGTSNTLQVSQYPSVMPGAWEVATLRDLLIHIAQWCEANIQHEAIVYLVGGWDAASTQPADYYRQPLGDSWRVSSWRTGPMSVTYETRNGATGKRLRVHVRVAAAWFDETPAATDVLTLAAGYDALLHSLRKHFGAGAYLLGTPAQTGLDLLEQSLPYGLELPVLPQELRELIQHNSPQGRNEVLTAPDGINSHIETLDALQCYDAKWMYAACLSHVPAGRYVHMDAEYVAKWANSRRYNVHRMFAQDPHLVGFYRVFAEVPADWHHIGLLPTWEPEEKKTLYPWQPRTVFESWCTGAELQLAVENSWQCEIQEAIIWPDAQKLNPLRTWHDKLVAARAEAEAAGDDLVATALRHILIDALGALARHESRVHHITPRDQKALVPDSAANVDIQPWGIEWDSYEQPTGWAARFQHPEISAMVWGRARARLAKFALPFPVERFILGRTDGWWTDGPLDLQEMEAARQMKPGEWRVKEYLPGPDIPAPRDTSEALVLMRRARGRKEMGEE